MSDRVILDLCAGSGAWSQPYVDAGYKVIHVTLPEIDVRLMHKIDGPIHGILAAPPCTIFCRMRMCRGVPTPEEFREGLSVVDACLRAVVLYKPAWWALENPQGWLKRWLGEPVLKFHPSDYGDPWTKRTWLWGQFTEPKKNPVEAIGPWIHRKKGKRGVAKTDSQNPVTPPAFAMAFFEANP
jgi:hypothetical protein